MEKNIVISPEGLVNHLVFEPGDWACGGEEHGIGVQITRNVEDINPGGVLKREDMKKLVELFTKHLEMFPLD